MQTNEPTMTGVRKYRWLVFVPFIGWGILEILWLVESRAKDSVYSSVHAVRLANKVGLDALVGIPLFILAFLCSALWSKSDVFTVFTAYWISFLFACIPVRMDSKYMPKTSRLPPAGGEAPGGEENIDAVYYVRPGDGGRRMKKRTRVILALVLAATMLLGVALLVRAELRWMEEGFAARQGRMQAFLDAVAAHDYEAALPLMQPALGMDAVSWLREATIIKKDYSGFAEGAVFKKCIGMGKSMRTTGHGWGLERRYTCLYEAGGEDYLVEFVFVELDGVDGIYNISIEPLEG